jgi:RHS repeat-associated protein
MGFVRHDLEDTVCNPICFSFWQKTLLTTCACILLFGAGAHAQTVSYGDLGPGQSINTVDYWCVSGDTTPDCGPETNRWIAAPFTPTADMTLTEVQMALNYFAGTNAAEVDLVNDVGGLPGTTVLETWSLAGLPPSSTPAIISFSSVGTVTLYGFTQYWLVAKGGAPDSLLLWWTNSTGLNGGDLSTNSGTSWVSLTGLQYSRDSLPAFNVAGTSSGASPALGSGNAATSLPPVCGAGDPVNCATGNLSENVLDLSAPGRGRILAWLRTYNSQAASAATSAGPQGFGWTSSFLESLSTDSSGAITVHQGNGASVTFTPSGLNYVAPGFVNASLVKNTNGTFTFTYKNGRADTFNSTGQLIEQTDRHGYVTSLAYSGGHLSTITDPAGRKLTVTFSGSQISSVTDPLGHKVSYFYDGSDNLAEVVDVGGQITRYAYDAMHQLISNTDRRGNTTQITYDTSNRVTKELSPAGRTITYLYGGTTVSPSTTITGGDGNQVQEIFLEGLLQSLTRGFATASAETWTFTYDPVTLARTGITDPTGNTWSATYDALGNLLTASDPLGRTSTFTNDSFSDPITATDALGVTTTYAYDPHGTLDSVSRPLNVSTTATITYGHSDSSHPSDVTSFTDPTSRTWHFTYDVYGDLLTSADPLGNTVHGTYNVNSWLLSIQTPLGEKSTFNRDNYGAVTSFTNPLGAVTSYVYDADHDLVSVTNADKHATAITYDADDLPLSLQRPDGTTFHTAYNGSGKIVTQTNGLNKVTSYSYDALDRVATITDPLSRVTSFAYDADSRLATRTDPVVTAHFGYDNAGQLISLSYSDGTPGVTFQYDALGKRIQMIDGIGTSTYEWDELNRMISTTDGTGETVSYSYDLAGRVTAIKYPSGGTVQRGFDSDGRLSSVADWYGATTHFTYDADSRLAQRAYPNHLTTAYSFDAASRLINIQDPLIDFQYQRDPMGFVLAADQVRPPAGNDLYTYNADGQLSADNNTAFAYDAAPELTQMGGTKFSYDAAGEVTSAAEGILAVDFKYDPRGNRVTASLGGFSPLSVNVQYDGNSRLTAIGGYASYAYSGDGLRLRKTVLGTKQTFAYDRVSARALPLVLEDGVNHYIYGLAGLPIEQIDSSGHALFFHQDQLGSTRALSNTSGVGVASFSYNAYGQAFFPAIITPLGFAGQYTDAESGLIDMRARFYDPLTGQFLTPDPLSAFTRQPYAYAIGNPVNLTDPSGLQADDYSASGTDCPTGVPSPGPSSDSGFDGSGSVADSGSVGAPPAELVGDEVANTGSSGAPAPALAPFQFEVANSGSVGAPPVDLVGDEVANGGSASVPPIGLSIPPGLPLLAEDVLFDDLVNCEVGGFDCDVQAAISVANSGSVSTPPVEYAPPDTELGNAGASSAPPPVLLPPDPDDFDLGQSGAGSEPPPV